MAGRRLDLTEHSDGPGSDPGVVEDTLATLARFNAGLLRTHAILARHVRAAAVPGRPLRVIDWGCGGGDVARALVAAGRRDGLPVEVVGVDLSPVAVALARAASRDGDGTSFVEGDALGAGPDPADHDLVVSSSFLHHLPDDGAVEEALRRSARARRGFAHLDVVRSRAAWTAFLLLGRPFCRRRETFEDGLVSILRCFTRREAGALAARAAPGARVEIHLPWRLCTSLLRP